MRRLLPIVVIVGALALVGLWRLSLPGTHPGTPGLIELAVGFDEVSKARVTSPDGLPPPVPSDADWQTAMQQLGGAYGASVVRCVYYTEGDGMRLWEDERDAPPRLRWAWKGGPEEALRGYPRAYDRVVDTKAGHLFLAEAGSDSAIVQWEDTRRARVTWQPVGAGELADCDSKPEWLPTTTLQITVAHEPSTKPTQTNVWASCGHTRTAGSEPVEMAVVPGPCVLTGYWVGEASFGRLHTLEFRVDGPTEAVLQGLPDVGDDGDELVAVRAWMAVYDGWLTHDIEVLEVLIADEQDPAVLAAYAHWREALRASVRSLEGSQQFLEAHQAGMAAKTAPPGPG